MTVSRKPRQDISGRKIYDTPLKVSVQLQSCKNLELHIDHLLGGRTLAGKKEITKNVIVVLIVPKHNFHTF